MASPHGRVHTPGARRYTPPANTRRPAILKISPQRHVHTPLRKTAHAHVQYVIPMPFDGCVFPHATTCDKNMMTARPRVMTPDSGNRLTFPMFPLNIGLDSMKDFSMKDFALHSTLKVRGKEYEIINITQYCLPNKNNTLLKQYHLMSGGDLKDLFFDDAENIYILCDNVQFVEMPNSKWKRISDDIADIVSSSSETHEKHARFVMFKKGLKYRLLEYHDHESFYRNADLVLPNYVQLTQNDISQKIKILTIVPSDTSFCSLSYFCFALPFYSSSSFSR